MSLDLIALRATVILAESGSESDGRSIGLLFLLSGFLFYGAMYLRYRNTDKRHHHESETEATMLDVRAVDNHVQTLKGVKSARLQGANNRAVRGRSTGLLEGALPDSINSALGSIPGMGSIPGLGKRPGRS